MSEVTSAGGFYSSNVERRDGDMGTGRVTFGGASISATDAAEFVMMHRTQVMKSIGADRTELAQQHLERIQTARQYLTDLSDLKQFGDTGKSYKNRIPLTPDMVDFLKKDVGCSPGEYKQRLVFYGSAVPKLPTSVLDEYGLDLDRFGVYQFQGGAIGNQHLEAKTTEGNNQFELAGVTVVQKDDLDTIKEEVNNYIDQQNDGNNLFMTKFKSVINSMNEALESASSMADKSHDNLKNLLSRW